MTTKTRKNNPGQTAAAREGARQAGGQFGFQQFSEPPAGMIQRPYEDRRTDYMALRESYAETGDHDTYNQARVAYNETVDAGLHTGRREGNLEQQLRGALPALRDEGNLEKDWHDPGSYGPPADAAHAPFQFGAAPATGFTPQPTLSTAIPRPLRRKPFARLMSRLRPRRRPVVAPAAVQPTEGQPFYFGAQDDHQTAA